LPKPLYIREAEKLTANANDKIRKIKADDKNWIRDLRKDVVELVRDLRARGSVEEQARAQKLISDHGNSKRTALKPLAADTVKAWTERIAEIERTVNGEKEKP